MLPLGAVGQDASKPSPPTEGCTTVNGVATGAGCEQATGATGAGAVTQGMPATKHQQEVLKTGDQGTSGQNMDATGAGGGTLPATGHQQDVLKKPEGAADKGTTQP
jgi:hypothetical protein